MQYTIGHIFKHKHKMKFVAIIPCYNHADTLADVLSGLPEGLEAIVVDDGSRTPVRIPAAAPYAPRTHLFRLERNSGKAAALRAGFALARKLGATHALTLDADGQHPLEYVEKLVDLSRANPEKIAVAARDFDSPAVPRPRAFMNRFSNFWFRAETGKTLGDTQCGFRCYPLDLLSKLDLRLDGFVFEVELLVKAAWAGADFCELKIPAIYSAQTLEKSHYRPIVDTLRFTLMNTRLFFASVFCGKETLRRIALKK